MCICQMILRYKAKSLDHEIKVIVTYIHIEVKHCVITFHSLKIWCSYVKRAFKYRAKSLDMKAEILEPWHVVCADYIHIEVNHCVIPFHNLEIWCSYVKWALGYRTKSLDHEDRNHWTMTCRSCYIEVKLLCHTISKSGDMMFIRQFGFQI